MSNTKNNSSKNDDISGNYHLIVGKRAKLLRENRELTVQRLATITNLSLSTIVNIERGKGASYETLIKIIDGLKTVPEIFFPEETYETIPIVSNHFSSSEQECEDLYKKCHELLEDIGKLLNDSSTDAGATSQDKQDNKISNTVAFNSKSTLEELGNRIRLIREARNYTLSTLASHSTTQVTALRVVETGMRNPSLDTLLKISMGLKVPMSLLFPGGKNQHGLPEALELTTILIAIRAQHENLKTLRDQIQRLRDFVSERQTTILSS